MLRQFVSAYRDAAALYASKADVLEQDVESIVLRKEMRWYNVCLAEVRVCARACVLMWVLFFHPSPLSARAG